MSPRISSYGYKASSDLAWVKISLSCSDGNCAETARLPHDEIVIRDRGSRDGAVRWG
jgi:hypothetical protein